MKRYFHLLYQYYLLGHTNFMKLQTFDHCMCYNCKQIRGNPTNLKQGEVLTIFSNFEEK